MLRIKKLDLECFVPVWMERGLFSSALESLCPSGILGHLFITNGFIFAVGQDIDLYFCLLYTSDAADEL